MRGFCILAVSLLLVICQFQVSQAQGPTVEHLFYDGSLKRWDNYPYTPGLWGMMGYGSVPHPEWLRSENGVWVDTRGDYSTRFDWRDTVPFPLDPAVGFSVTVRVHVADCTGDGSCVSLLVMAGTDAEPYPILLDIRPGGSHIYCDRASVLPLGSGIYELRSLPPTAARKAPCDLDLPLSTLHTGLIAVGDMTRDGGVAFDFQRLSVRRPYYHTYHLPLFNWASNGTLD